MPWRTKHNPGLPAKATACPLATDTLLNSRNQTILPTSVRHEGEPPPTHRSIQDANYHNQIVKEPTGASLTSLSSTCLSWQIAEAMCLNRQGPNSFCFSTPSGVPAIEPGLWLFWSAIFYRSTNQQSVAPALWCRLNRKEVIIPLATCSVNWGPANVFSSRQPSFPRPNRNYIGHPGAINP